MTKDELQKRIQAALAFIGWSSIVSAAAWYGSEAAVGVAQQVTDGADVNGRPIFEPAEGGEGAGE